MFVSGMAVTYEALRDDVERLVSMKAGIYTIPGFDREDVAQEIRVMCIKAMEKYDCSKNHSTPFNYLARCVDNRLRNLLRDNGATLPKSLRENAKAIARYDNKMKLQTALPIGDEVAEDSLPAENIGGSTTEFIDSINTRLETPELRTSFTLLINYGPPAVPKLHLRIIKRVIREIYPDLL